MTENLQGGLDQWGVKNRTSINTLSVISNSKFEPTELGVTDISIDGKNVNLSMKLKDESQTIILPISGVLCASYKTQRGINSTIIDIKGTVKGYEILLFEIFNDVRSNNLLVKSDLDKQPHIKVYIKDAQNNIYLFEAKMPFEFSNLIATDFGEANKEHDALWASELVEHEIKEIPTDNSMLMNMGLNVQTRGLNSWTTWINPTTYYDSFVIRIDTVDCYSLPYVMYKHANVTSADTTWAASFKVSEHMKVAGVATYHGNNTFEYRNVKISFGCGDKTMIMRTMQQGRVYDYSKSKLLEVGQNITLSLLKKAVSSLPYGSTVTTVLSAVNSMSSSTGTVVLGSTGTNLSSQKLVAVGEKLNNQKIEECTDYNGNTEIGDYFTLHAILNYAAGSGSNSTVGVLKVDFDKYYTGDSSYTPISKTFNLTYSSNP